jgi:hypothetical protein
MLSFCEAVSKMDLFKYGFCMYLSKWLHVCMKVQYNILYTDCLVVFDVGIDNVVVQPLSSCIMVCICVYACVCMRGGGSERYHMQRLDLGLC